MTIYHVYSKSTKEVIYHSLTVDELESKIVENVIQFKNHEIIPLESDNYNGIDASY